MTTRNRIEVPPVEDGGVDCVAFGASSVRRDSVVLGGVGCWDGESGVSGTILQYQAWDGISSTSLDGGVLEGMVAQDCMVLWGIGQRNDLIRESGQWDWDQW